MPGGAAQDSLFPGTSCVTGSGTGVGPGSVHLGHIADHPIHIGFPGLHAHDGQDGIDPVVLFAVDGFHIEPIDLEDAEDVTVFDQALRDAVAVIPHVIRLFVERESIECTEVHVAWIELRCDRALCGIRSGYATLCHGVSFCSIFAV